ncbi:MAG: YczE/YyaS/YitT family protein [Actinomycetota bacterium]
MREAPRLRGGVGVRLVCLFVGLAVIAAGIAALLESRLGLLPWDVLHQGIARHSPLLIGQANIAVALVMLVVAWLLGQPPGLGTVANAIVIGWLVDVFIAITWVDRLSGTGLGVRVLLVAAGLVAFSIGSTLYIGAAFGAGPRDSTMLALARRTGRRIAIVRATIELSALAVGWVLGGTVGVGTAICAILVGPAVEAGFWVALRLGLATSRAPALNVPPAALGPAD